MSRWLGCFCRCSKKRQNVVEVQGQLQNVNQVDPVQQNIFVQQSENDVTNIHIQQFGTANETKNDKFMVSISTKYYPSDVQIVNETPEKGSQWKYNCPICMKFLSTMLISQCCKNYVCVFCAIEISKRKLIILGIQKIRCPHCNKEGLVLKDVKSTDEVKKYVDSPIKCLDFKSDSAEKLSE